MTYTGKCPYCGTVVRSGHGNPLKRIDSPLRTCWGCKRGYLDENMYEWAVLDIWTKIRFIFFDNCRYFLYIFGFLLTALNGWTVAVLTVGGCALACGLWFLATKSARIRESRVRCMDRDYVDRLVKNRYTLMDMAYYADYEARHKK